MPQVETASRAATGMSMIIDDENGGLKRLLHASTTPTLMTLMNMKATAVVATTMAMRNVNDNDSGDMK